jgi:GrpB-like predicted nucleotidyltransferase (UPF0157 family)
MVQRHIVVVPYDTAWAELYTAEAEKLKTVFGSLLVEIHHIGSTSIPGLAAKPVIDILPLVKNIEQVDELNDVMAALGYIAKGEAGISGRRFFIKPSESERTHHVHTFQVGDPEGTRHLAFRAYLIAHPELISEYAELKIKLAEQFTYDIYGYMDGKDAWIKAVEQKALLWFQQPYPPSE